MEDTTKKENYKPAGTVDLEDGRQLSGEEYVKLLEDHITQVENNVVYRIQNTKYFVMRNEQPF